jgi:hypothetical protein
MPMNGSRCTPAHGAALLAMADPQIQEVETHAPFATAICM